MFLRSILRRSESLSKRLDSTVTQAATAFKEGDVDRCIAVNLQLFEAGPISKAELQIDKNWMKLASARINTAFAYKLLGDFEKGATQVDEGIKLLESHYSQAKPEIAHALDLATELEISMRNLEKAQALVDKALDLKRRIYNSTDLPLAHSLNLQGAIRLSKEALNAAEGDFKSALVVNVANFGRAKPLHQQTAVTLSNLAGVYRSRGLHGHAAEIYEHVVDSFSTNLGEGSWIAAQATFDLGASLAMAGKKVEAREVLVAAVSRFVDVRGSEHPSTLGVMEFLKNIDNLQITDQQASPGNLVEALLDEAAKKVEASRGEGVQGEVHVIDKRGHVGHGHPLFTPLK